MGSREKVRVRDEKRCISLGMQRVIESFERMEDGSGTNKSYAGAAQESGLCFCFP